MRKTFLVFSLIFLFSNSYAQTLLDFDLGEFIPMITDNLKEFGLVPDLSVGCGTTPDCEVFGLESTQAFFIIFILLWMVLNIAIGLGNIPSMLVGFFVSSLVFKYVPAVFNLGIETQQPLMAMGLFKFVFSGLFIFIWLEYIMRYLFAFSKTTKLFLQSSITLIAIFFLDAINVFDLISNWLTHLVSKVGFVIFIVFMLAMRIISAYSGLLSIGASKALRKEGSSVAGSAYSDVEKFQEGRENI